MTRPFPGSDLYWDRWYPGLAILRRCNQANNRSEGTGTWLVTAGQANDRELDSGLDETTDQS